MELESSGLDRTEHRRLAVDLFNFTWSLLDKTDRTADEADAMVHAAHTSAYHWLIAGEPANHARGHWQCARVYAEVGRAEPALHHARRYADMCAEHNLGDFDRACALEATARAHTAAGDHSAARKALDASRAIADTFTDQDEIDVMQRDFDNLAQRLNNEH